MVSNALTVKVRWSESDPAGIVFYPRFFEWFDLGTEALFESLGLPWTEMFPAERDWVRSMADAIRPYAAPDGTYINGLTDFDDGDSV